MFTPLTPGMCRFISDLELSLLTVAGTWCIAQSSAKDRKGMESVSPITYRIYAQIHRILNITLI